MDILTIFIQIQSIHNSMSQLIHLRIALSLFQFLDNNDALLINSSDKISALSAKKAFHALYRAVIFLLVQFQDHNYTTDICFNMKLLRSVVNIHQKKIIKKKILDKAVFVKTLLVRNDQILDLEGCKLAYHISILIISVGYQDIFQLIIITDLKVLKSLDKLAVCLGFYKSLDICRLDFKIRKGRRKYLAVCVNDTKFRP